MEITTLINLLKELLQSILMLLKKKLIITMAKITPFKQVRMENKINRGAIFKNLKKEKETQPDYSGTINVEGVEKQIALWVNTSKSGMQYFSVLVSEPYAAEEKPEPKHEAKKEVKNTGFNDLPF